MKKVMKAGLSVVMASSLLISLSGMASIGHAADNKLLQGPGSTSGLAEETDRTASVLNSGDNLIANPGFEDNLASWTNWGNTAVVTSPSFAGVKAARVSSGEGGAGQIISGISPGTTYVLSGHGSVSASSDTAIVGVDCLDVNNNVLAKNTLRFNQTLYEFKSTAFTTVPGTAKLQVYIYKNADSGANAYLDDLSLKARSGVQAINKDVKAMWVWQETTSVLQDSAERSTLFQFAQDKGVNVLLLYINKTHLTTNNSQLKQFISQAHAQGIRVEAVSGEIDWGLTDKHSIGLERITDVITFNGSATANEKFDGVHQDIEVYRNTTLWEANKALVMQQALAYIDKAKALMNGTGMTYAQDIPRWYDGAEYTVTYNGVDKGFYKHLIDRLDWVGLMDYTDRYSDGQWQAVRDAQNEIDYAAQVGKKVTVGLETIDPVTAGGDSVTFYEEGLDDLDRALAALKAHYDGHAGFGGVAVHSYGKQKGNAYYSLPVKAVNHY
ncbi:carbohydrate binding domain-containing protein [Paenibacillus sp. UNC499MF]|uniref:carbohydrate binding domain-containing protein n=1 Tax=Paenibacillus sp. UNC499MF TaxID=1502751 RepID=UPI00089FCF15|nr:carbohydrate binding domain-containing protein [Paenibacillus sp. UNC499MF]SEG71603.1 Carbohydrate binding domain-containing protein [Paenibacillus sp. UNC499MF]